MNQVSALLLGGVVSIVTAWATSMFYVHRASADLQSEYEKRFNERKWEAYRKFAGLLRDITSAVKSGQSKRKSQKFVDAFYDFMPELWLVASDEVTRAFLKWRRVSLKAESEGAGAGEAVMILFEILIHMRRDLGYESTDLSGEELLGTFINDVDFLLGRPDEADS